MMLSLSLVGVYNLLYQMPEDLPSDFIIMYLSDGAHPTFSSYNIMLRRMLFYF